MGFETIKYEINKEDNYEENCKTMFGNVVKYYDGT